MASLRDIVGGSLTTKLLVVYVPLLTLCVVSMFAILEYNRTATRISIQKETLERLALSQNAGIAKALWEYDIDSVEAIVSELAANPDFHQAIIREVDGTIILDRVVDMQGHAGHLLEQHPSIEEELSLVVNGERTVVGSLQLTFHNGNIERELISNLRNDALIVLGLSLVIVVVTVFATRTMVGKPLYRLRESIQLIKDDGVARAIEWHAKDEIGALVAAFNDLQTAQEKSARELRRHRDELEHLVAERTKALAESEATLNSAFENMPDGFFMIDRAGKLVKFNNNYADNLDRLGISSSIVKEGTDFEDIVGWMAELGLFGEGMPDEEISDRMHFYRSDETGRRMIEGQTGEVFEVRKAPLGDGASVNIMVDLTEIRRSQEKLRESEERLRFAMDSVGAQFWVSDVQSGAVEYSSSTLFDRLGVREEKFPKSQADYIKIIHPDDRASVEKSFREYILGASNLFEIEYRIKDAAGGWHWVLSRGRIFDRDAKGHVRKITGISLDIDEMKRKSELLNSVLGSMNQGIVAFDEDLRLIVRNNRFLEIRDYPMDLATEGASFEDLMHYDVEREEFGEGDPTEIAKERVEVAKLFQPHFFERTRPTGSVIEVSGGPLPSGGFVSTYTDVTERRLAEAKLADAYSVISGSIEYAARIQRSVLPTEKQLDILLPEHYVVWEPRDIVGGDLYWVRPWGTGVLVALGDCTGHGVPGAFMTLIATGALEQSMKQVPPGNPAQLLQRMHQMVQNTLGRASDGIEANDGLEIGLCYVDTSIEVLKFSGARFALFQITDEAEEIIEIKGDKTGIGYPDVDPGIEFTEELIVYSEGDSFHMVSDGVIDQVGGERRRAFGKKRYKAAIWESRGGSISQYAETLEKSFDAFKGDEARRDDISAIGFVPSPL